MLNITPLSPFFLYLNERVLVEPFCVLLSLMMILPAIIILCSFGGSNHLLSCHILGMGRLTSNVTLTYDIACGYKSSFPDKVG